MPLTSQFYGILICMYQEKNERHHMPHFHAFYGEYEAEFDFNGKIIEGKFPLKQNKLVESWSIIHEEELKALWRSINELGQHFKIDGLK